MIGALSASALSDAGSAVANANLGPNVAARRVALRPVGAVPMVPLRMRSVI